MVESCCALAHISEQEEKVPINSPDGESDTKQVNKDETQAKLAQSGGAENKAEASRAFLRMIGNVLLLMLSAKGFKDQLNSAKLERLQAMLKRKPSTPSLPDSNPSSIIDLTYDPETKSYLYQQKPNAGADLNQPLKKITLIAERTLAKNALGEIPTFKIRSDRKILRCSSPCEELAVFVLKQIENLLTHSDESIRNNAEKLRQHTQQIVQDSKTQVKDDNTLLDELVQLESDMTELRLEARKKSSNPSSSLVNFKRIQETIGNEVVSQVLRERGLPGLEALQRIGQTIDLNDFKNLINEPELGSGGLIEVENKRGSYFIKLVLEIAQKAEESGVITKNQKIKAAIPLLKETSSHEEFIGKLSKKIQEQNSIVSKARRTYNEYRNRPDKKLQEEKILQLEASKAKINLTELENAKQAIVTTSGRIEVILNPCEWAELPCFSGDTLVWLVNGIKRIDELQAGELVLAFDFQTQQVVNQKIIKVLKNETVHFYEIQVGGSIIQATGNHPFWVESKLEWIAARDLKEGMLLKLINDKSLQIESIILRECLESNTYNLSIDNIHNYFVGSGILVHNEGEIDYGLGGNHKVYIGKNPKYPQKIYIGMTKDIKVREKIHHQEAKEQIKYLTEISKDSISLKEQADLEFYQFKLGMKLEVQAKGILNDDMAKYLEENLVRFYEKEGQKEIMNREQGRISNTQMNEWAKEIAQDPNVINMKYCQ